ncbi:MAG: recombinase, partial [Gammaproteobacteria bacterium CG11_big_fil_rev_8_21_14_0_20_46_22]
MGNYISATLIKTLKPKDKHYDVRDKSLKGFLIRVNPSGNMSYVIQYWRSKRMHIGKVGVLKPEKAREKATQLLGLAASGEDPKNTKYNYRDTSPTIKEFLEQDYQPWVEAHNVAGDEAVKTIKRHFSGFFDKSLDQIKLQDVERLRTKLIAEQKPNSINRVISDFRSLFSKALEWDVIKKHPLSD